MPLLPQRQLGLRQEGQHFAVVAIKIRDRTVPIGQCMNSVISQQTKPSISRKVMASRNSLGNVFDHIYIADHEAARGDPGWSALIGAALGERAQAEG
jgi:hypothetical protein